MMRVLQVLPLGVHKELFVKLQARVLGNTIVKILMQGTFRNCVPQTFVTTFHSASKHLKVPVNSGRNFLLFECTFVLCLLLILFSDTVYRYYT